MSSRPSALVCSLLIASAASAQTIHFGDKATLDLDAGFTDAGFVEQEVDVTPDAGMALVPPKLLADSAIQVPEALRFSGLQGAIVLDILIDEEGAVAESRLVSGLHEELDHAAVHSALALRFEPARLDGKPVAVRITWTYPVALPTQPVEVKRKIGVVQGLVRSMGNRVPVVGAALHSDHDPKNVVETDGEGRFRIELPRGYQFLIIRAPGFKENAYREEVRIGETVEVIYSIEPLISNPYETTVRGEKERTEVTRVTLQEQEIREVPGTGGDPFRVVMLMPGVGSAISGLAFPIVRGSQPAATGYFIDGVRVPILFHAGLGPAVIHPDFIDRLDFYPGNAPVQFGRFTGGIVEGRTSRPRDDRLHATAYADLINAGGFVEYPFKQTGTSITAAGRYSYTPWLAGLATRFFLPEPPPGKTQVRPVLDFYDYQARVEQKLPVGRLRLLLFGASDTIGADGSAETAVSGSNLQSVRFDRYDLRYLIPLGGGDAEFVATYGTDQLDIFAGQGGGNTQYANINIAQRNYTLRSTWKRPLQEKLELQVGAEFEKREAVLSIKTRVLNELRRPVELELSQPLAIANLSAAWVQLVNERVEDWTFVPALRVDNYHLLPGIDHLTVEPRLTLHHKYNDELMLRGGAGVFHQPPALLLSLPVVDLLGLRSGVQETLQFDVGATWTPNRQVTFSADIYFNPYLHVLELPFSLNSGGGQAPPGGAGGEDPTRALEGFYEATTGHAYGFELMVRHPLGDNWFGWLSYSLSRSVRYYEFNRYNQYGEIIATYKDNIPFLFDQTHIFNGVLSYKFASGWTLGTAVHFNTGRPEYPFQNTQVPGFNRGGFPNWIPVDADKGDRLPPFFRVDGRVQRSFVFEQWILEAYLDFLNLSISQEVVGYSYGMAIPFDRDNFGLTPPASWAWIKEPVKIPIIIPALGLKGTY